MNLPSVTQSIQPAEDAFNPTMVSYKPSDSAGKNIGSLYAAVYPASADVTVVTRSEENALNLMEFLRSKGVAAELGRHTNSGDVKPVIIRNMDSKSGLRDIASLLGEAPDSIGIAKAAAMQVMDYELARTGVSLSDAGLATFKNDVITSATFGSKSPRSYMLATIAHPLSAVTALHEDGAPTEAGIETYTNVGVRDGKAAVSTIEHLERANIPVKATRDAKGTHEIKAYASAESVAEALSPHRLIPASVAVEITNLKDTQKPRFAEREAQRPPSGGRSVG